MFYAHKMIAACIAATLSAAASAQSSTPVQVAAAPAADAKQSAVEASAKVEADKVLLKFKVVPAQDMVMNYDGPWKLVLNKHEGLNFAKATFVRTDMDDKLPGYVVQTSAAPASATGQVEYTATVFVCDKEKTRCFREVHKGTIDWKKA